MAKGSALAVASGPLVGAGVASGSGVGAGVGAGRAVGVVGGAAVVQTISGEGGLAAGEVARARLVYPHPNNLAFFLERVGVFAAGLALPGKTRSRTTSLTTP